MKFPYLRPRLTKKIGEQPIIIDQIGLDIFFFAFVNKFTDMIVQQDKWLESKNKHTCVYIYTLAFDNFSTDAKENKSIRY